MEIDTAYTDYCLLVEKNCEARLDRACKSAYTWARILTASKLQRLRKFDVDDLTSQVMLRVLEWYQAPPPLDFDNWADEFTKCVSAGVSRGKRMIRRQVFDVSGDPRLVTGTGQAPTSPDKRIYLKELPVLIRKSIVKMLRTGNKKERAAARWVIREIMTGEPPEIRKIMRAFGLSIEQATFIVEHVSVLMRTVKLRILKGDDRPDFTIAQIPVEPVNAEE